MRSTKKIQKLDFHQKIHKRPNENHEVTLKLVKFE